MFEYAIFQHVFEYAKEVSHLGDSLEYLHHLFWKRNKKSFLPLSEKINFGKNSADDNSLISVYMLVGQFSISRRNSRNKTEQ